MFPEEKAVNLCMLMVNCLGYLSLLTTNLEKIWQKVSYVGCDDEWDFLSLMCYERAKGNNITMSNYL